MSGIPYYAFPKNDGSMINKAPVPRKSFGMMAFSYNGERIAVSTKDENSSYLGIIQIDETGASQVALLLAEVAPVMVEEKAVEDPA